jgi:predicted esterase
MKRAIWVTGLLLSLTSAGCSLGDAAPSEATTPVPGASSVKAVHLALSPTVDAETRTITGEFQFDPAPKDAAPALSAALEVRDSGGTTVARLDTTTDQPVAIPLPSGAKGLLTVNATVTDAAGGTLAASANVLAGTLAELRPLAAKAEKSLRSRLAGADEAQRRELERQLTVVRYAQVWLQMQTGEILKRQVPAMNYIARMLPAQAGGHDYMLETHGSHLALFEHPDLEWGGVKHTRFWVHLPPNYESRTDWPLAIFLHGSTRDPAMIESFRSPTAAFPGAVGMPCVAITPKSEVGGRWQPEILNQLLDHVLAHYRVDAERVSVVGHSAGGVGTMAWATHSPQRIAAIAPTAGMGSLMQAHKMAHIPAWFVHGTADNGGRSVRMTEWLRRYGAEPRLTLIPRGKHMDTFAELEKPAFWNWMVSHRRTKPPAGLEAPKFGEDGLTRVEQVSLPAQRLLYVKAGTASALPANFDGSLEARLYETACTHDLDSGVPVIVVRPGANAPEMLSGIYVRGAAGAPKGLQVAELPSGHCARVLYRGSPESLTDTVTKLQDQLRADGAHPTGELRCTYWSGLGRRGRAPGQAIWELVFVLEK